MVTESKDQAHPDSITITLQEYGKLMADSAFLSALHRAGVDNWEGYSVATEEYLESE